MVPSPGKKEIQVDEGARGSVREDTGPTTNYQLPRAPRGVLRAPLLLCLDGTSLCLTGR
jgi:hypothetical protein